MESRWLSTATKAAIFRVNAKEAIAGAGYTQFGRAMQDAKGALAGT
jgi:hypothetical protein